MRNSEKQRVTVSLGEGTVVLHRSGQSRPIIANILGIDKDTKGEMEAVWLDRVVHQPGESEFEGWYVSGAVSTVLRRKPLYNQQNF